MAINPVLLFAAGLFLAWLGKKEYGKWYNPVSFYSVIWGVLLGMHELKLIDYPDMRVSTWLLVFSSWGLFILGGLTALISTNAYPLKESTESFQIDESSLAKVILVLCAVGSIGVVQHWLVLKHTFGSIETALLLGNLVYNGRNAGEISGMVPYVADFILAAVCLSGVYFRSTRKLNHVVIVPLILAAIESAAWMGRAKILIAGILIFSAYSFSPIVSTTIAKIKRRRWALVASSLLILLIIVLTSEGIRQIRKVNEGFYYATPTLNKLKKVPFITPSIYVYLSGQVAVLDKFLRYESAGKGEKMVFGANTFAPLYRVVSKITGGGDFVAVFQTFYTVPIDLNTGTYLRELYSDFGEIGALVFPYFLGFLISILYVENKKKPALWKVIILAHLFVYIGFTFAMEASRWGYWWDSLVFSLIAVPLVKTKRVPRAAQSDVA